MGVAVAAGAVLVAQVYGAVVAALVAAFDGWRGNMYRLAVAPAFRRRGLGSRLVAAGEAQLRELGAPRVTALVAFDDVGARGFWEAVGYAADPVMGRMVGTSGERQLRLGRAAGVPAGPRTRRFDRFGV